MRMIKFDILNDDHPALVHSPLLRGVTKTIAYANEHDGIGLTASGAFKRTFVHWAAGEFDWPGHSEAELFKLNKVLNEADFPPLKDLHDVLLALKLGGHEQGKFMLTSFARNFAERHGHLFGIVAPFFLMELDHKARSRRPKRLLGNWDIWLNVLNVEAEGGVPGGVLRRTLYGEPKRGGGVDDVMSNLYVQVLRPLCWAGLLVKEPGQGLGSAERVFWKTPLWRAVLRLQTDDQLASRRLH